MQTKRAALIRIRAIAADGGHRLGIFTRVQGFVPEKYMAHCVTCKALAMIELDGVVWGCYGGVVHRSCQAIVAKKAKRNTQAVDAVDPHAGDSNA